MRLGEAFLWLENNKGRMVVDDQGDLYKYIDGEYLLDIGEGWVENDLEILTFNDIFFEIYEEEALQICDLLTMDKAHFLGRVVTKDCCGKWIFVNDVYLTDEGYTDDELFDIKNWSRR